MIYFDKKLEDRLSHANGALGDIMVLCTSCVPKNPSQEELVNIMSAIHQRILCSASKEQSPPSYFRHEWERKHWEAYLNGQTKACATDRPCIEVAKELMV